MLAIKLGRSWLAPSVRAARHFSALTQTEKLKTDTRELRLPEISPDTTEEPGECSAHKYAEPGAARGALHYLATKVKSEEEMRSRALCALRGAQRAPQAALRDLADSAVKDLQEKTTSSVGVLRRFVMEASEVELEIEDAAETLVTVWPVPQEAWLSIFNNVHGRLMLGRVKPMDVLWVPEERPHGFPHSAHAFLRLLQMKKGPFYRDSEYILVTKAEYEHFPWIMQQIRIKAPEFFYQYRTAELKTGRSKVSLHREADAFLTVISEKLFALAMILHMPSILQRQEMLDASGSPKHRWLFAREFQLLPPPLSAVKIAFGIDATQRDNITADHVFMDWQRSNLWRRKRTSKFKEKIFPTVKELGNMALATHLRHRPFQSMLSELNELEEPLLRPWYTNARPEEAILNVLWSREMLKALSKYCMDALHAMEHVSKKTSASTRSHFRPFRVLCVGSSCSRLRFYLHYLLTKVLKDDDVRVAAVVPERRANQRLHGIRAVARWPPSPKENLDKGFSQPEAGYTLDEALEVYSPCLVLCVCMPPDVDWSSSFRKASSVMEYLLIGPADTKRSGKLLETWGLADSFGRMAVKAPYLEHFTRQDLWNLSECLLGSDDAPGRVGTNNIVSFRRLVKPNFSLALKEGLPQIEGLQQRKGIMRPVQLRRFGYVKIWLHGLDMM